MSEPTATARELVAAILAALRAHFGAIDILIGAGYLIDVATDEAAPALVSPWLRLHVMPTEVDAQAHLRPGRIPLTYLCQIQCCLSTATADFSTELAEFASNVMTLVAAWEKAPQFAHHSSLRPGRRWGLGAAVDPPRAIACNQGALDSLPHGHDALIVSWEQTLYRPERLTANDPTSAF